MPEWMSQIYLDDDKALEEKELKEFSEEVYNRPTDDYGPWQQIRCGNSKDFKTD